MKRIVDSAILSICGRCLAQVPQGSKIWYEGGLANIEGCAQCDPDVAAATAPKKPPVCYVLVRKDLPKTRQAIDIGHAAQECVRITPVDNRTALRVLWVKDMEELLQFEDKLPRKGYDYTAVVEPDEPYSGQVMSLATTPIVERLSGLGKLFYHLERMDLDK